MDKNIIDKYMNELSEKLDIIFKGLKEDILNDFESKIINGITTVAKVNSELTVENSIKVVNEVIEKVIWGGDSKGRFVIIRANAINNQLKAIGITKNTFYEMLDLVEAFRKNKEGKYTSIYAIKNSTMRAYKLDKYYLIQNNIGYCNDSSVDKERFQIIDNRIAYVIKDGISEKYIY